MTLRNDKNHLTAVKRYLVQLVVFLLLISCGEASRKAEKPQRITGSSDNAGLTLPDGFGALKVADSLGNPRHIAVTSKGGIYLKLREPVEGHGILYLEDKDGDGVAESREGFGDFGGTGIYVTDEYLYASSDEAIFRYGLDSDQKVELSSAVDTVVTGLVSRRQHATKSFTLDGKGNIYVNIGAYSNACQEEDRSMGSKGMMPCPILDSAGGIWQFKIDKRLQSYADGKRFATGLRNVVGLDWDSESDHLFVMQHGRDQLNTLYPDMYDTKTASILPAEAMYMLNEGDDAGWPYIYFDQLAQKKIVSPEYGGDGKKTGGENALDPVVAFPGHMAPNALLFYTGDMFPERYKNGAFVAFHGSWNRAPEKQAGYMVAFVPFSAGKPSGKWEIFADGFAGIDEVLNPDDAAHRPTGLAQGPDGSLYVSDDAGGTLFRIVYNGNGEAE